MTMALNKASIIETLSSGTLVGIIKKIILVSVIILTRIITNVFTNQL